MTQKHWRKQTNGDKSSNALKENVKNNANKMIL